jgi:putative transposase
MNNYNPAIHNNRSIRLQGYDYSQDGLYFITICLQNRLHLFGDVVDGNMVFTDAGSIAIQCWMDIPKHFPNTILHQYIIMPNHVHGIIQILNNASDNITNKINQFQKIIPRSIGSIVRGFKIGVTKWFRNKFPNEFPRERKIWQRNYYEHIIRNEKSFERISNYISNNPMNWKNDKYNKLLKSRKSLNPENQDTDNEVNG